MYCDKKTKPEDGVRWTSHTHTHTHTHTHLERERERETGRQRDRVIDREKHTERNRDIERNGETERRGRGRGRDRGRERGEEGKYSLVIISTSAPKGHISYLLCRHSSMQQVSWVVFCLQSLQYASPSVLLTNLWMWIASLLYQLGASEARS